MWFKEKIRWLQEQIDSNYRYCREERRRDIDRLVLAHEVLADKIRVIEKHLGGEIKEIESHYEFVKNSPR